MGASQVNQVLLTLYTEARKGLEPVSAWAKLTGNSEVFQVGRGQPRTAVDDRTAAELVSAAIVHTLAAHGREGVAALAGSPLAGVIGNVLDEPPIPGPRRADWARSAYVVLWGAQGRRSPGVPWVIAGRYKGQKVVAIGPHPARLSDETLVVRQGTDAALAMAVGHVLLKEFFLDRPVFTGGDLSYLVRLRDGAPLGHPDGVRDTGETAEVLLPRSEGALWRGVRVVRAGGEAATTVLDLLFALYGVARDGLPGRWPSGYDDRSEPYTPAWQEGVTGVTASRAVKLARELGVTAEKTGGQCVIMPGSLAPEAVTALLALLAMTGGGWALPPAPRVLAVGGAVEPLPGVDLLVGPGAECDVTAPPAALVAAEMERLLVAELAEPSAVRAEPAGERARLLATVVNQPWAASV